ncbi:MAG TPA: hypothetical protein VFP05_11640 [Thermomicrobiales bacterium]|nr:hypothetical protein [Thermomicrobiales bacterium]
MADLGVSYTAWNRPDPSGQAALCQALVDLAIYLQCDFDRADLSASLRWSDDRIEAGARGYPA